MGQCGCGDMNVIAAYKIGDKVLIVDEYHGCSDCGTPTGIFLHLFTPEEAAFWLDGRQPEDFNPDEERVLPFIGRDELVEAAKEIEQPDDITEYGEMADWIHDKAIELLQTAMRKRKWTVQERG